MLDGRRILVVHREPLIGMVIADRLADEGAEIVGPASNLEEARQDAEEQNLAAAVLNFLFEGGNTLPIAERLRERGVPLVFFTGADQAQMARVIAHLDAIVLGSPADFDRLASTLARAIGDRQERPAT